MTLSQAAGSPAPTTNENYSQLGRWLEEYNEIATILPVVTGLLVTTQLRLRGGTALLVNIAIAAATRQVILQLKKQGHSASEAPTLSVVANPAPPEASPEEDYTIVHSVPGRIRLRVARLRHDALFAKRLEKLLLSQDLVRSVRINRAASSIAIGYDSGSLSDLELGMQLLQILEQAEQESPAA
ncbi:MAG: HMA2 domain-containing protein [Spirulina sp.]